MKFKSNAQRKAVMSKFKKTSSKKKSYNVKKQKGFRKNGDGTYTKGNVHYVKKDDRMIPLTDDAWMYYIHKESGELDELSPSTKNKGKKEYKRAVKG